MNSTNWIREEAEDAIETFLRTEEEIINQSKHFMSDFADFIDNGNVLELATGIMLGGAFSKIVNSLIDDILTPPLGLVIGRNFENAFMVLKHGRTKHIIYQTISQAQQDGAVTLNLGNFIQNIMSFIFIGLMLFLIVRFAEYTLKSDIIKQKKRCKFCRQSISVRAIKCPFCCEWMDQRLKPSGITSQIKSGPQTASLMD